VALGVAGALAALLVDRYFLVWTSPVFLGLTLSALLSLHTSRARPARGRHRLLQVPEEASPPPVLARALALRRAYADAAGLRRQIEALFRAPVPVHRLETAARSALRDRPSHERRAPADRPELLPA
jgi:membrane glycosyltransferase